MDQSLSLISATVQITDTGLVLVHIPLDLYPFFVQPLLRLLYCDLPSINEASREERDDAERASLSASNLGFINFSVTPVECSVVCSRQLAERFFMPLASRFNTLATSNQKVWISDDDFIAMQVEGQGLDAGRRVLELTGPLALAGISIFFISTYFSDYILVPDRSKDQVVRTLSSQGFTFETDSDQFINNIQSPSIRPIQSQHSSPPSTPQPATVNELQARTFEFLRKNRIIPRVDQTVRLVQCSAHHRDGATESSAAILRNALTAALLVDHPRFLSLTLTPADPAASLLLEKRLLPRFTLDPGMLSYDEESSILLGSKEDILIPITLDLRDVPIDATGIVCGVAGRLADATAQYRDTSLSVALSTSSSPADESKRFSFGSANIDDLQLSDSISSLAPSTSSSANKHVPEVVTGTIPPAPEYYNNTTIHKNDFTYDRSQSTGITHHLEPEQYGDAVEISFLSTARAGTVLVWEREINLAVQALDAEKHHSASVDVE